MNLNHDPFLREILRQPPDFHTWMSHIYQRNVAGEVPMTAVAILRKMVFQESQMEVACQAYARVSAGTMEDAMLPALCRELRSGDLRDLLALYQPEDQECVLVATRDALFRTLGRDLVRHPYFRPLLCERFGDDHPRELMEEVRSLLTRWHAETFETDDRSTGGITTE